MAASTAVSPAGRRCGQTATAILAAVAAAIDDAADELGRIDAVAGDGDHGRGMVKGTSAALAAATTAEEAGAGAATVLIRAGDAWASQAGGTSGVLWGAALAALGRRLGDDRDEITGADVAAAVRDGLDAITTLGKAKLGDKTMVDALGTVRRPTGRRDRGRHPVGGGMGTCGRRPPTRPHRPPRT